MEDFSEQPGSPRVLIATGLVCVLIGLGLLVQTIVEWNQFAPGSGTVVDITQDPNCSPADYSGNDCTVVIVGYSVGSISYESQFGSWIGASVGDPVSLVYDTRNPQVIEPQNTFLRFAPGPVFVFIGGMFVLIGFKLRQRR